MERLSYEAAKDKAFRLLEFRSHSEKELSDKLLRAGADEEDVGKILDLCREYSLVNDAAYALRKAKDLKNFKKYGRRRIERELYSKGISAEDVRAAMEELDFDDETLLPLVRKKLRGDFERKSTDRCIRYFMYRGYNLTDIKNCIETVKGETDEL